MAYKNAFILIVGFSLGCLATATLAQSRESKLTETLDTVKQESEVLRLMILELSGRTK